MHYQKRTASSSRLWYIGLFIGAIFCFVGGLFVGQQGDARAFVGDSDGKTVQIQGLGSLPLEGVITEVLRFEQFWDLWRLLQLKYYKDVSERDLFYGALAGMAAALDDPYTSFFEPVTAQEFTDSLKGEFEGIGAEIGIRDHQLQIIAPLPNTPAEQAGLSAGDAILAINGTSTDGFTVEEAVMQIRGEQGTPVTLTIGRIKVVDSEEQPDIFDVEIIRDRIHVQSVLLDWKERNIAVIQIRNFNQDTAEVFNRMVVEALDRPLVGIILDLRNNPGGYLDRSTEIAGAWVGDKPVVVERRKGEIIDQFHGRGNGRLAEIPTVVLVNGGSASASEIVAGALQDYGLATIIGTQTFGKGSVQDYTEFDDGSGIKITIAEWLTPNQRSINGVGINPDIIIERTIEEYHADKDPQLEAAIQYLRNPSFFQETEEASSESES